MIKTLYTYGVTCLLAILLFACQQESLTEATKGSFSVSLADEALLATTKAQQSISDETAKQFHLCIRNEAGYTLYDDAWTNQPIPAPEGSYTLEASMGKNADVAFDSPYYTGEAKATIQPKQAASVTIPCKVANALVSINWENKEALDQVFTNYGVKVVVNQASAQLTPSEPNRKVYLKAGEAVAFYFVGTLRSTGEKKTAQMTSEQLPQKLDAAQHLILTLKTDDRLAMQIEKAEIKTETISATIPLEWLPKPKVTGFANQATSLTYTETADAIDARLAFTASHTIQDLEFTLDFGDEQLQSLNKTYLLSNLTDAEKQSLSQAGITLNTQGTEGNIDLTQLTASLRTNKGEAVDNRITLRVKANDRWSSEAEAAPVYTIQTVKPEFSVSVYPKNIWTKEFTVNELMAEQVTSGSYEQLKKGMTYQYSEDGTNWKDITTDLCQKGLSPNKAYYVRSCYREGIYSQSERITTYPETALSSVDMESWTIDEIGYYYNAIAWKKYPVLTYSVSGWTTNNDFTTRYRDQWTPPFSTLYHYNTFPAVSCTKEAHGGTWAAELRNTAAGRGNTSSSKSSYDVNNVPGELFLGKIEVKTEGNATSPKDSYTITQGIAYASKPTALAFYYKYKPFKTDAWKVSIALLDENDQVMATKEVEKGDATDADFQKEVIPFEYNDELYAKPAKICVYFASSKFSGADLPYESRDITLYKKDGNTQSYPTLSGSALIIDDIQLIYDK